MPEWYDDWKETTPDERAAYTCDCCGKNLFEGDYMWKIDEERLCEECAKYSYREAI